MPSVEGTSDGRPYRGDELDQDPLENHLMFVSHHASSFVALLAALNLCIPWNAVAAQQPVDRPAGGTLPGTDPAASVVTPRAPKVVDVALAQGGWLTGQVIDTGGRAAEGVDVAIIRDGEILAHTATDQAGAFAFTGVAGGTYQLATADTLQLVRTWAPQTAPPAAVSTARIVQGDTVVRGQNGVGCGDAIGCDPVGCGSPYAGRVYGRRPVVNWLRAHPGMMMAGIAAAIAIPVSIAASDDDDDSHS